jgi:hypothetical protein
MYVCMYVVLVDNLRLHTYLCTYLKRPEMSNKYRFKKLWWRGLVLSYPPVETVGFGSWDRIPPGWRVAAF